MNDHNLPKPELRHLRNLRRQGQREKTELRLLLECPGKFMIRRLSNLFYPAG